MARKHSYPTEVINLDKYKIVRIAIDVPCAGCGVMFKLGKVENSPVGEKVHTCKACGHQGYYLI